MTSSEGHHRPLTQRAILFFWLPLAFSWMLMTFEGPWIQGVISRRPDAELQLAAFGIVFSLMILIESPVIMLLATSSALSRDGQAYRILSRFAMGLNVFVTIVAVLMAFTPLLDLWLGGVLGIPPDVIDAARPGVALMILFPGFIGYRRFYQGILINHNHTRVIGTGTILRLIVSAGLAMLIGAITDWPGVVLGGIGLGAAVAAESLYVRYMARADVADLKRTPRPASKPDLNYGAAMRFHLPLALTSIMTLLVRPLIESGLASTDDARAALAAWPVIFSIFLILRSGGMAWQEVVIALSRSRQALDALRRFTLMLGFGTSGLMLVLSFTPAIDIYTGTVLGIPENIQPLVKLGAQIGVLIPMLTTFQSYLRALLMRSDRTARIYQGMALGFGLTAATMFGGLALGLPGIMSASLAMTLGLVTELAFLFVAQRASAERLDSAWEPALAAGD